MRGLDPLIKPYVELLNKNGIDTFSSCQGGQGHTSSYAWISGRIRRLSEVGKITKILVEKTSRCYCGSCRPFDIEVHLRADALGVSDPIEYFYTVQFRGTALETEAFLHQDKSHRIGQDVEGTPARK